MKKYIALLTFVFVALLPLKVQAAEPEGPQEASHWGGAQYQLGLHLKVGHPKAKRLAYRLSFITLAFPKAKINPKFLYGGLRVEVGKYASVTPMAGVAIGFAGSSGVLASLWADLNVGRFTAFSEQDVVLRPSGMAYYHLSFAGAKLPKGVGVGVNTEIIGVQNGKATQWFPTFGGYVSFAPKPWFVIAAKTFTGLDGATNVRLGLFFFIA